MRGFILQPTYRLEAGRPVVHLYGRLEEGRPFLVRDGTGIPHFFIRTADGERARKLGAGRLHTTDLVSMDGEPVSRVEVAIPSDTPPLRDRLVAAGIPAYEADVRFAMRFLIDRGLKGAIGISGTPVEGPGGLRVFESPRLEPGEWEPELRVLSLDIETDPRARQVFSAALHGAGAERVIYVRPPGSEPARSEAMLAMRRRAGKAGGGPVAGEAGFTAVAVGSEAELIDELCVQVGAADPDVITGWNVVDFDLRVLSAAARRAGRRLALGRTREALRLRLEEGTWRSSTAEVVGRIVMDGIDLLRGAFVRLQDYRLQTAATSLLGKGKLLTGSGRAEEIQRLYREDLPAFLEYNFNDARLVTEILEATGVVRLSVRRSLLTGMPPDRVSASIASFDSLYLHELRKRGVVAPSVGSAQVVEGTAGGAVLEPVTGLHRNVLVYDFRSLYPSLIRTYNIDPLGLIREGDAPAGTGQAEKRPAGARSEPDRPGLHAGAGTGGGDARQAGTSPPSGTGSPGAGPIRAPNGALFRREPGILPGLLDRLFSERAAARARDDAVASQAIKILMNSCYGVLATPACRFYSSAVANAITRFGQATLMWARQRAEALGYGVLYGDTDSLFIASGTDDASQAEERGRKLLATLNRDLTEHVRESQGVRSHLELELQCLYLKLFLPALRHGTTGARKRYAGLLREKGRETIHYTGMEMVRRDWTELSKIFQRGLFERVFRDEDPAPYIREFIAELREGKHDEHLVYRKALRKRISEYTSTTPPHVKAAKKMGARPGQLIDYVITVNGPEPASSPTASFDYGHYIEKQIRPVAEAVLTHLGLDFDEAAGTGPGEGRQMGLFS